MLDTLARLRDRAERVRAAANGRPLPELLNVTARAIRAWLSSTECVLVYVFPRGKPIAPMARPADVPSVRWDAIEDFLLYTGSNRWVGRQRMMAAALRSLHQGEHCLTIEDGGVLGHYRWIWPHTTVLPISEVAYQILLPPRSGAAFDAYTEPSMRGRGYQKIGLRLELEEAFRLGCDRVFNATVETNAPSRKNIEETGYLPFARVTRVRRLGWSRVSMERLHPKDSLPSEVTALAV